MKRELSKIKLSKKGMLTIVAGVVLVMTLVIAVVFLKSNHSIIEYEELTAEQKNQAPAITKIEASQNQIVVNWDKAENSDKYIIYRKESQSEFEEIATVDESETSYSDENTNTNVEYTYKVVSKNGSKLYASSPIHVVSEKIDTPQFTSLERAPQNYEKDSINLSWKSEKDAVYHVLRKSDEADYTIIDKVTAKEKNYTYKDKNIDANKDYTYSIRRVKENSDIVSCLSDYDKNGIVSIGQKPNVSVDFTNLRAKITWDKLDGYDHYEIFRKTSSQEKYKKIKTIELKEKTGTYEDVYHDSFKTDKEKSILAAQYFMDASVNGLVYTVRGYSEKDNQKIYSSYLIDGDFHLEAPAIVKFEKMNDSKGVIEWSTIKNAHKYYIYGGNYDEQGKFHWENCQKSRQRQQIDKVQQLQ